MTDRTTGYARAIVDMAEAEGELETVENELLTLARVIDEHPEVREKLADIQIPPAQRMKFVEAEAFTAAHPVTRSALAMVIAGERASDLGDIAREVARQAAASRDRELAEVYVAVELDDQQRQQLHRALEQATGKDLEMKVYIDEDVIGGVRAKVGDTVIDGSLAGRLDQLQTRVSR
ncbi:MAG: ATP synthase F1 subunit delta [Nitriliruptorales bacterium]|nr:ATP synthase F1 subunit delta [Nitriliruptorales bacterium]